MKIYVIDTVITGANHIVVNSGLLRTLQCFAGKNATISFWGDPSHIQSLKATLEADGNDSIVFNPIKVVIPNAGPLSKVKSWWSKLRTDKKTITGILNKALQNDVDLVVFSTIISFNLWRFQEKIAMLGSKVRLAIVLHGEIEYLFIPVASRMHRIEANLYRRAFAKAQENLTYITLNKLIREKLVESGLIPQNRIIYIEHPIGGIVGERALDSMAMPKFSFIGVANKRKGGEKIFELAQYFEEDIQNKRLEFRIVGRLEDELAKDDNGLVQILGKRGKPIPQGLYGELILGSTFALSFMSGEDYVFRISGSIMDAIQYQIPLIALKHPYIDFIFEEAGDIGYICDNLEEMRALINDVVLRKDYVLQRYAQQVKNLNSYSSKFKVENIAELFLKNMKEVGWDFNVE